MSCVILRSQERAVKSIEAYDVPSLVAAAFRHIDEFLTSFVERSDGIVGDL